MTQNASEVVATPFAGNVVIPSPGEPRTIGSLKPGFDQLTSRTRELDNRLIPVENLLTLARAKLDEAAAIAALSFGPPLVSDTNGNVYPTPTNGDQFLLPAGRYLIVRSNTTSWYKTRNGKTWAAMAAPALAPGGMFATDTRTNINGLPIVTFDPLSATPRMSTDHGANWSDAGTAATGITCGQHLHDFGIYVLAGVNKIYTDPDLSGAWTSRSVPAGWSSETPLRIVPGRSANSAIIIPSSLAGTGKVLYSINGTTWTQSAALPSAAGTVIGACHCVPLGAYYVSSSTGGNTIVHKSDDDGATWSLEWTLSGVGKCHIACLGKTLVLASDDGRCYANTDNNAVWMTVEESPLDDQAWNGLEVWNGRLVLGAYYVDGSDDELDLRISGRQPDDLFIDVE